MILQRLYALAVRERLLDEIAFEMQPVPFAVKIGEAGEFLGIEDRRGETVLTPKKKGGTEKRVPDKGIPLSIPRPHGSVFHTGFARYFCDTLPRVLPVDVDEADRAKAAAAQATFWQQIGTAAAETRDPAAQALQAFGRTLASPGVVEADLRRLAAGPEGSDRYSPVGGGISPGSNGTKGIRTMKILIGIFALFAICWSAHGGGPCAVSYHAPSVYHAPTYHAPSYNYASLATTYVPVALTVPTFYVGGTLPVQVSTGNDNAGLAQAVGMGEETVDRFNAKFKIGDEVTYYENLLPVCTPQTLKTRSAAYLADSGHPVVFLEGISGYVSVFHIRGIGF